MTARRMLLVVVAAAVLAATLAWLRDPPWLARMESGFRDWTRDEAGVRGRWIGGHASFFVPADAAALVVPVRTSFASPDDLPITVWLTIDDRPADRVTLTDGRWQERRLRMPPPGSRHLRRIDIRTDRVRDGNRGVMVGEITALPGPDSEPSNQNREPGTRTENREPGTKNLENPSMRAIVITEPGPPDVLKLKDRPRPSPGPGDVLIEVAAAGVNRPDVLQRLGRYAPPPGVSDLPGLEVAGTVVERGAGTTRWRVGDRVCALVAGGGYAELCVAPEPQCLPVPSGMDLIEAAAIPETYFTVWSNVFQRGRLQPGERLLVHGGASGIGTTAIQLASALDAEVFATAGSDRRCRAIAPLGARAINYRTDDFVAVVKEATGGRGVDVVLDMVGGDYLQRNLDALAIDGRLVQIGLLGGSRAALTLATVMQRRLTITGSTLRPRPVAEKAAIASELEAHVWPLLEAGRVRPIVHTSLPLARAADAHRMMEAGEVIGKVVLTTT